MAYLDTGNVRYRVEDAGSSVERYAQVSSALPPILRKTRDGDQEAEGRCQKWRHGQAPWGARNMKYTAPTRQSAAQR
jgi:hypothetical protein